MFKIIILGGVCFGVGYVLHEREKRSRWERAQADRDHAERAARIKSALDGVWSEPRPLIADLQSQIDGPGHMAATSDVTGRTLEVPLTPASQRAAWSAARHYALEGETADREATIARILQQSVVPSVEWNGGWQEIDHDRRFREVYECVGQILDIAECSCKYGPRHGEARGALVFPGWVHERPAPTADLRVGDFVEVMIDAYSDDPEDEGRTAEWAWVKVESIHDDKSEAVAGRISMDPPTGQQPHVIAHTAKHGFRPADPIVVPRAAIFRVLQA
jgi:hypothetical protein